MTTFKLWGGNPFDNHNANILGIDAFTDEDGIKIGDYDMRKNEEEMFGVMFRGIDFVPDRIDDDTQRVLHGGTINFDIVYATYFDEDMFKNMYSVAYEYTDNMSIINLPVMVADVLSDSFHDFIREKTNIKDHFEIDFLSFMLDPTNREYYTRFIYLITIHYLSVVHPSMTIEEVEYYAKLKRIVNILDEK